MQIVNKTIFNIFYNFASFLVNICAYLADREMVWQSTIAKMIYKNQVTSVLQEDYYTFVEYEFL